MLWSTIVPYSIARFSVIISIKRYKLLYYVIKQEPSLIDRYFISIKALHNIQMKVCSWHWILNNFKRRIIFLIIGWKWICDSETEVMVSSRCSSTVQSEFNIINLWYCKLRDFCSRRDWSFQRGHREYSTCLSYRLETQGSNVDLTD